MTYIAEKVWERLIYSSVHEVEKGSRKARMEIVITLINFAASP